jgi:hypothetical protein
MAINENKEIIIRRHVEDLTRNVGKVSVDFVGEKVVVIH